MTKNAGLRKALNGLRQTKQDAPRNQGLKNLVTGAKAGRNAGQGVRRGHVAEGFPQGAEAGTRAGRKRAV